MYYIYASYNIILLCLSEHIETQEFVETAFENTMLMSKVIYIDIMLVSRMFVKYSNISRVISPNISNNLYFRFIMNWKRNVVFFAKIHSKYKIEDFFFVEQVNRLYK